MQRREGFDHRCLEPVPVLRRKTEYARWRRHRLDGRAGEQLRRFLRREITILSKPGQVQPSRRGAQKRRKCGRRVVTLGRFEKSESLRFSAAANRRKDVDDSSPTDGSLRGL